MLIKYITLLISFLTASEAKHFIAFIGILLNTIYLLIALNLLFKALFER